MVPARRAIQGAEAVLREEGVLLYPTDTTYAMGVRLSSRSAFEKLCRLRQVSPEKNLFSVFLPAMGAIGSYALGVDTPTYRLLKRLWPGLYTVILRAGPAIPRHLWHRHTIGFRVTEHPIVMALLQAIDEPIVTASVPQDKLPIYEKQVDGFLDAGPLPEHRTTVIDLSEGLGNLRLLRAGDGDLSLIDHWIEEKPTGETALL
jgi:tRNA threonylcarbamoyl adenosine modification protein (Sua5/YciO/YrdC/YwlC family)